MLPSEWLDAVVPIGERTPSGFSPRGIGVVMRVGEMSWLVTAGHVVSGAPPLVGVVQSPDRDAVGEIVLGAPGQIAWVVNQALDIAVHPFTHEGETSVKVIAESELAHLAELRPSAPAYSIGVPMGLAGLDPSRPTPFVLGGIVSAVSARSNEVYSTAVALPACSGSPLVARREDGSWALAGLLLSLVGFQQTGPATQLFFGVARSAEVIGQALAHMRLGPPAMPPRGDGTPPDRSNLN